MSLGRLRVVTAGESHGPQLTIFVENLPAGMPVLAEDINVDLARRQKGYGRGGRQQIEHDCVEIVAGVPARTAGGRIVWTTDADGARRLLVAADGELAAGRAEPVTPPTLQVREILSVDGDTVLFAASAAEPTEIELWTYGPAGLSRVGGGPPGISGGVRAGGTTVTASRDLQSGDLAALQHHVPQAAPVMPPATTAAETAIAPGT